VITVLIIQIWIRTSHHWKSIW